MDDMRSADIDFLTIGQYLRPTPRHHKVERFVEPPEFEGYARSARAKGFHMVSASPLTRSSYHAGSDFERLRDSGASVAHCPTVFARRGMVMNSIGRSMA